MNPSTKYSLTLSFTQEEKNKAEEKAKISSDSNSSTYSYNTELNYLCSQHIIKWLEEEVKLTNVSNAFSDAESENMYQFINGTAINIEGERRLIIIPSSCIEPDTMTVPQEWVDIFPADYYLALQVDLDENFILSYGFSNHKQLKEKAEYDPSFRKYELDVNDMIDDIVVLLMLLKQQIQERAPINIKLSSLPSTFDVESIINYDCGVAMSRLLVPFETWGAVWADDGSREQLYKLPEKSKEWSIWQWLQSGVSEVAAEIGWVLEDKSLTVVVAKMIDSITLNQKVFKLPLTIAGNNYQLIISLVSQENNEWKFALQNVETGGKVPHGFKLRLLDENGEDFENNEGEAIEEGETELYVKVQLEVGEGLIWETEPMPDNYYRQVMYF